MKFKDIVDSCSLEYAKLKIICPIIVSAEFLKGARERFLKTADRTLRIGSVASVALAPYTPVFSPQEKAQSAEREGHTLTVDPPLDLNGIPPLETPDGRRVVFTSPEAKEQQEKESVWFGGIWARFNEQGQIVISTPWNKTEHVHLEPHILLRGGVLSLSPDGKKIAVALHSRIGTRAYPQVFVLDTLTGQGDLLFSPELIVRGMTTASFFWSADSQKVAAIVTNFDGKKELGVFQADTREMLTSLQGVTWGTFSPDSSRFAVQIGRNLQVINLQNDEQTTLEDVSRFSWSKDSSLLVLNECTQWIGSKEFGPACVQGRLAFFNIGEKRRISLRKELNPASFPLISPDNTRVLLSPRQASDFVIFDIRGGRITPINFPRRDLPDSFGWDWDFWDNEQILFRKLSVVPGSSDLVWVDARTSEIRATQQVATVRDEVGRVVKVFPGYILSEVTNTRTKKSTLYLQEIPSDGNRTVRGREVASFDESPFGPYLDSGVVGILKEGEQLVGSKGNFLFLSNRLYRIKYEETAEYFGGQKSSIPEGLVPFIPEGENISFRPGDAVGDKENKKFGIWYLRNGKRYWIQNWEGFLRGQRRPPETEPVSVSKAILERIPEGEVPEPILGRDGILDWDGRIKEYQPFGGRMVIFIGGYDGNTTSQLEAFVQIKAKLREKGWSERQFLEATYNIGVDAARKLVLPTAYFSEHTKIYPPQSFSKMRLQIQRYKEMFPLTKFIIIGHSLGGLEGLEATLAHTDAVQMVITLDSPIKGVDRAALNEHFGPDIDGIIRIMGEEVGRYLVSMAENPAARQAQEDKVAFLRSRGVRIFTFSNDDDWFVRNRVSVLDNSDSEFEGQPVELIRHLGHFSPRDPGDFISGHGQILQEGSFLEELARILPPS